MSEQEIINKLTPVITRAVLKRGIGAVVDLVIECVLNKDGRYCYWCTDRSRHKFWMMIDHNGEPIEKEDTQANILRKLLAVPLRVVTSPHIEGVSNPVKEIKETHSEIMEIPKNGQKFISALSNKLPDNSGIDEDLPEEFKQRLREINDPARIAALDEKDRMRKRVTFEEDQTHEPVYKRHTFSCQECGEDFSTAYYLRIHREKECKSIHV